MLNKKTDNKIYVYQGIDACGKFEELERSIGVTLASWANFTVITIIQAMELTTNTSTIYNTRVEVKRSPKIH